jgi:hypothetical protein
MQKNINLMKLKRDEMKGKHALQAELFLMKEKKTSINIEIRKLSGQKIEAELQVRTLQCKELTLSLAIFSAEQQLDTNSEALAKIKKLVAEQEAKYILWQPIFFCY